MTTPLDSWHTAIFPTLATQTYFRLAALLLVSWPPHTVSSVQIVLHPLHPSTPLVVLRT